MAAASIRVRSALGRVLAVVVFLTPLAARGETAYCAGVRARAAGDAALLMAPELALQGIRFPEAGPLDLGETVGDGYQARGLLSFSPVRLWKGVRVLGVGDALCAEHESLVAVEVVLERAVDGVRATALRAQERFLAERRDAWRAAAQRAESRLAARVITVTDFLEVQRGAAALEHKLATAGAEAARLEAGALAGRAEGLPALAARYAGDAVALERAQARTRLLDGWDARVSGGVIPWGRHDWFGLVEVSFNLGWPVRASREARHGEARRREVEEAAYEPPARLTELRSRATAELRGARREGELVDEEIAVLRRTSDALRGAESPGAAHARDIVAAQLTAAESERARLGALVDALTQMTGGSPDADATR